MPETTDLKAEESERPAPLLRSSNSAPSTLSPFKEYDEAEGVRTPEPIKVVRSKKKPVTRKKKLKELAEERIS